MDKVKAKCEHGDAVNRCRVCVHLAHWNAVEQAHAAVSVAPSGAPLSEAVDRLGDARMTKFGFECLIRHGALSPAFSPSFQLPTVRR